MATTLIKGARITGAQRGSIGAEFARRYEAGDSIRAIAEDAGRSFGFVHGVLREAGVALRGRGGATRRPKQATEGRKTAAGKRASTADQPSTAKRTAAKRTANKRGSAKSDAGSVQG